MVFRRLPVYWRRITIRRRNGHYRIEQMVFGNAIPVFSKSSGVCSFNKRIEIAIVAIRTELNGRNQYQSMLELKTIVIQALCGGKACGSLLIMKLGCNGYLCSGVMSKNGIFTISDG